MTSPPRTEDRSRFTVAAVAAAVVLAVAGSAVATAYDRGIAMFAATLSFAFAVAVVAVVGAIVTLAIPGNRVGWLLLSAAAILGVGTAFTEAGIHGVVTAPGSVPGAAYLAALGPGLQAAGMLTAVVGVPVVFPDGHLPGPRWRWLAWSAIAAIIFLFLASVLAPHTQESRLAGWHNPLGLPVRYGNVANAFAAAGILLAVAAAAGAIAGLVTRWRRGGPLVRQQLLFLALATVPPALVFLAILMNIGLPTWIFGVVLLPLPIAIAILHDGLFDLRHAAYRTLVWLTMSAAVVGIYAAVVITVTALVPDHHAWWSSARSRPPWPRLCSSRCATSCSAASPASSTAAGTSPMRSWPTSASAWKPPPTWTGCWTPWSPSSIPGWTCATSVSAILTEPSSPAPEPPLEAAQARP